MLWSNSLSRTREKASRRRTGCKDRNPFRRSRGLRAEPLEQRQMLSVILWANRGANGGADTDAFAATYGAATAPVARAIVDRALHDWETVIEDFNYGGGGNTYSLRINAGDLGDGTRGSTGGIALDAAGKPTSANITIDDNGGGAGWYFDPTPNDDAEFGTLQAPFTADSPLGGYDFYRTIAHEIGHAMGITIAGGSAINNFLTPYGTDASGSTLQLFNGPSITMSLVDVNGRHIYEGPAVAGNPFSNNDLMNDGRTLPTLPPPTRRELITDVDALVLGDAYNYTIKLPSTINTFYANLNRTTGVLTVDGSPDGGNDQIVIDMNGSLRVQVNGTEETFDGTQGTVTSIVVNAGAGNDFIHIGDEIGIP